MNNFKLFIISKYVLPLLIKFIFSTIKFLFNYYFNAN